MAVWPWVLLAAVLAAGALAPFSAHIPVLRELTGAPPLERDGGDTPWPSR